MKKVIWRILLAGSDCIAKMLLRSLPLLGGQAEGSLKAFGKVGRALETGLHGDFGDGHFIIL